MDIKSLIGIIDHLEMSVEGMSIQKDKKAGVSKTIENLRQLSDRLNNADTLLKEAGKSEDRAARFQLLSNAKLHIEKASGLIEKLYAQKF